MSKKNHSKRSFRIPIALHIYFSLILVSLLTVSIIYISNSVVIDKYIRTECDTRIDNAVKSCQNFATAFRSSITPENAGSSEAIRDSLMSSIVSATDISNDASIVLFSYDNSDNYTIMWPTASYSASTLAKSTNLLENIITEDGLNVSSETQSSTYEDNTYYYRFVTVEYSDSEDTSPQDYDKFYLLVYVNTSTYYSFTSSMNFALFRSIMLSIIASAVISVIVAFPIFYSTHKLSRFAGRVGRGNFMPLSGHIISRELSDLADTMNMMAGKLQESDIEQKTFFQNASHELRTPLMSIQGYAEGIKYDIFDDNKKDEAVDIIIAETQRLSTLVENLLSISKMDMSRSGTYEVKKQKLDVHEIVEMVIERVRGGFLHANKQMINNIKLKEQFIYANENDIFRMLENLFSNCLRYSESTVWFNVYEENGYIIFNIEDDGPGISKEMLPKLFERFAKGSEGKHGIGLALAKAIAEEHKGTITAGNRTEGSGASFTVRIPTVVAINQLTNINNMKDN